MRFDKQAPIERPPASFHSHQVRVVRVAGGPSMRSGRTSETDGHSHAWAIDDDGVLVILEERGHSHVASELEAFDMPDGEPVDLEKALTVEQELQRRALELRRESNHALSEADASVEAMKQLGLINE